MGAILDRQTPAGRPAGLRLCLIVALALAVASSQAGTLQVANSAVVAVRVQGSRLVNAAGAPVRLLGVNRSGTEYQCMQGNGIFDGPSDSPSLAAIAAWHADAVRVPLNEDCWLDINGVTPSYAGAAYQRAIHGYVSAIHQAGMVAVLDLHWSAPGGVRATGQLPMADADHSPTLWASVASSFRSDPGVVFDLYNEPFLDSTNAHTPDPWTCWRDGCTVQQGNGIRAAWRSAGMQQLLEAVRSAGATQPVMIAGLRWSNDLGGWLSHRPRDPQGQTVASFHLYNFNECATAACWDGPVAAVAGAVPVVTGELGEDDCAHGFIDAFMRWADDHGVSYLGWAWNADFDCRTGPGLVVDYRGTPTSFGAGLREHLARPGLTASPALAAPTTGCAPATLVGRSPSGPVCRRPAASAPG